MNIASVSVWTEEGERINIHLSSWKTSFSIHIVGRDNKWSMSCIRFERIPIKREGGREKVVYDEGHIKEHLHRSLPITTRSSATLTYAAWLDFRLTILHEELKLSVGSKMVEKLLLVIIAIFIPPLAVYLHQNACNQTTIINLILTLLFFLPGWLEKRQCRVKLIFSSILGLIHALYVILR